MVKGAVSLILPDQGEFQNIPLDTAVQMLESRHRNNLNTPYDVIWGWVETGHCGRDLQGRDMGWRRFFLPVAHGE